MEPSTSAISSARNAADARTRVRASVDVKHQEEHHGTDPSSHAHHHAILSEDATPVVQQELERRQIEAAGRKAVLVISTYSGGAPPLPVPPPPPRHGEGSVTSLNSVFTLCNSAIGAGVLGLPFAFSHLGLVGGIIMCVVVGLAEAFTLYVLSKFAERYHADTYGVLVRRALGRKWTALLAIIMILYLLGSSTVYLMIMGDSFSMLGEKWVGPQHLLADRNKIILGLSVFVLLPLCLLKRLGHLASLSMLAVFGFIFTATVVLYTGLQEALQRPHILHGVSLFRWDTGALFAIPIVVFGFNCHANVVSIFSELSDTPDILFSAMPLSPSSYHGLPAYMPRPSTHKLINMMGVIAAAISIIMGGYITVGVSGYVGFLGDVQGNVMDSLPQDMLIVQVSQFFIGIVVMFHYPLNHFPARSGMHDVLNLLGIAWPGDALSIVFTLAFVASSSAVAVRVHSLGDALSLIGGTAASFMIFFLPGLLLLNASVMKESRAELREWGEDPEKEINEPLLRKAQKGIKAVKTQSLAYRSGKSWAAGIFLLLLSFLIFAVTMYSTFKKHP